MKTFEEYHYFNNNIIKALNTIGFKYLTPIQEKIIPVIFSQNKDDIIALSQTGTGKTAAFGLPIIQKINYNLNKPQALILCPTRELCIQITRDLNSFSKFISSIEIISLYGGTDIKYQIKSLKKKNHIIVGTPGRIFDLLKRKKLYCFKIKYLVLDEADEMLSMGFKEMLDFILDKLPKDKQSLLFSATMSKYTNIIAKKYLISPKEFITGEKNTISKNIKHFYYEYSNNNKYLILKSILNIHPNMYGIIFCKTKKETKNISEFLIKDGYNTDALYGDLSQSQRENVMTKFRNKKFKFLISTDLASRGLDVHNMTHIINYSLPDDINTYLHRSGRTGRAGKTGNCICMINVNEKNYLKKLKKKIGKSFKKVILPSEKEILNIQIKYFIDKLNKIVINTKYIKLYPYIKKYIENYNKDELIKRLFWINFKNFIINKNNRNIKITNKKKIKFYKKHFYKKHKLKNNF